MAERRCRKPVGQPLLRRQERHLASRTYKYGGLGSNRNLRLLRLHVPTIAAGAEPGADHRHREAQAGAVGDVTVRSLLSLFMLAIAGLAARGGGAAGLALMAPLASSITAIADRSVERTLPADLSTTWGA